MSQKKYTFNPKHNDAIVDFRGQQITSDTLTDEIASVMLRRGIYDHLIMKVEDVAKEKPAKKTAKKTASKK
jgi:hypothetical protein